MLSTDVAPTILRRLGCPFLRRCPGSRFGSEGSVDVGGGRELGDRLATISERRGPAIGVSLAVWLLALGLAVAATAGSRARQGEADLGSASSTCPRAAARSGRSQARRAELLLVTLGAPLLGCLTLAALGGYRALAIASGLTVLLPRGRRDRRLAAHLALPAWPKPRARGPVLRDRQRAGGAAGGADRRRNRGGLGRVRASASTCGASSRSSPSASRRLRLRCRAVRRRRGAAIVLPVGAAVWPLRRSRLAGGARRCSSSRRRSWRWPLLALVDLTSGANAHLTRSVLDAGGLNDLADVAQRRLQLRPQLRQARRLRLPAVDRRPRRSRGLRRDSLAHGCKVARRCAPG